MSKLAEIRKSKYLSQNDLVKATGISRSVITKYESGERNIDKASGETLLKLATALSCKIEDLLERKDEIMENVLFNVYKEWRKVSEEMLEDGMGGSVDCGEESVRKDFSDYAGLEEEITFEDMYELEKRYEGQGFNRK